MEYGVVEEPAGYTLGRRITALTLQTSGSRSETLTDDPATLVRRANSVPQTQTSVDLHNDASTLSLWGDAVGYEAGDLSTNTQQLTLNDDHYFEKIPKLSTPKAEVSSSLRIVLLPRRPNILSIYHGSRQGDSTQYRER